jgi:spore coat polysaccharide biosynthesis protein SpsF
VTPKVVAFVQARMSSRRLPGKVLAPIVGEPMLARVLSRACRARTVAETWVLTSEDESDDPIENFCEERGILCFRGSLDDVLDRFVQAARVADPEIIVRITADCPLVDPEVIDRTVEALMSEPKVVYAATRMPEQRTFPVGIDVEVFRREALERAAEMALDAYQREHVTPWFYDGSQADPIVHVQAKRDLGGHRWTVDTPEDLAFIRGLWPKLPSDHAGYEEIAAILDAHPELRALNAHVRQRHYRETES